MQGVYVNGNIVEEGMNLLRESREADGAARLTRYVRRRAERSLILSARNGAGDYNDRVDACPVREAHFAHKNALARAGAVRKSLEYAYIRIGRAAVATAYPDTVNIYPAEKG